MLILHTAHLDAEVKVLTNLSLDSRAAWPMEDVELVRGVLVQSIADSQAPCCAGAAGASMVGFKTFTEDGG